MYSKLRLADLADFFFDDSLRNAFFEFHYFSGESLNRPQKINLKDLKKNFEVCLKTLKCYNVLCFNLVLMEL